MLLTPWFLFLVTIFVIHQVLQKIFAVHILIIDSYLDPLLFMPILLQLVLWEKRVIYKKEATYRLDHLTMFSILFVVAIVCEYIFPLLTNSFTSDWLDVFCYTIGTIIFAVFLNKASSA